MYNSINKRHKKIQRTKHIEIDIHFNYNRYHAVTFMFFMSDPYTKLTYSPKIFRSFYFKISETILAFESFKSFTSTTGGLEYNNIIKYYFIL